MDSPQASPYAPQQSIIVAQPVHVGKSGSEYQGPLETLIELCQRYPAYTLQEARKLPHKHVLKMIKLSRQRDNRDYLMQLRIASAPHTEKGKGVKELMDLLKEGIE